MRARQGKTLVGALCAFIGTVVVIQLWLVSAALEAFYGNEPNVLWPALVASAALFAVNAAIYRLVRGFDQRLRAYEAGDR
jgi:predicted lysophospholipase L1 biosynthesis ABC-type transport system permease subunit